MTIIMKFLPSALAGLAVTALGPGSAHSQSTAAFEDLDDTPPSPSASSASRPTNVPVAPTDARSPSNAAGHPFVTEGKGAAPLARYPSQIRKDTDHWYGWQTLIADGGSVAIGLAGGLMDSRTTSTLSSGLLGLSVAGYVLGAPGIHWGHGKLDTGASSFLLRVGLPLAGLLLAYALGPKCNGGSEGDNRSLECLPYMAGGAIVGGVAAAAVDAIYLAHETIADRGATPTLFSRLIAAPFLGSNQRGIVLRGTF